MSTRSTKITAATLIFLGIYLNIPFSILGAIFDYPNILRQPTGQVLTLFKQGGGTLIATWYAFALAPVIMIVAVQLLYRVLKQHKPDLSSVSVTFGILAGVFQVLGLIRWVFVVPALANTYTDPASTEAARSAAVMVFQGFHQYAGVALGEHLGQLCTASWMLLTSLAILHSHVLKNWQGWIGVVLSAMMFLGLIEGFATVGNFNAGIFGTLTMVSFIGLSLWMISLGVVLLMRRTTESAKQT